MIWDCINLVTLVKSYKAMKLLWKPRNPDTWSKDAEDEAWRQIANYIGASEIECRKKMAEIIKTLNREELQFKEVFEESRGTKCYQTQWDLYKELTFILDRDQEDTSGTVDENVLLQEIKDDLLNKKSSSLVPNPKVEASIPEEDIEMSTAVVPRPKEAEDRPSYNMSISAMLCQKGGEKMSYISTELSRNKGKERKIIYGAIPKHPSMPAYPHRARTTEEKNRIVDEAFKISVPHKPRTTEEKNRILDEAFKRSISFPEPLFDVDPEITDKECSNFAIQIARRLQNLSLHARNYAQHSIHGLLYSAEGNLDNTSSSEQSNATSDLKKELEKIFVRDSPYAHKMLLSKCSSVSDDTSKMSSPSDDFSQSSSVSTDFSKSSSISIDVYKSSPVSIDVSKCSSISDVVKSSASGDDPKPSSSLNDDQKPSSSLNYVQKPPSAKDDDLKSPSASDDDPKPSSASDDDTKPSSDDDTKPSSDDVPKPSSALDDDPKPSSASDDNPKPSSSLNYGQKPPSAKDDYLESPSASDDDPKLSLTSDDNPKPPSASDDGPKPSSASDDDPKPSLPSKSYSKP